MYMILYSLYWRRDRKAARRPRPAAASSSSYRGNLSGEAADCACASDLMMVLLLLIAAVASAPVAVTSTEGWYTPIPGGAQYLPCTLVQSPTIRRAVQHHARGGAWHRTLCSSAAPAYSSAGEAAFRTTKPSSSHPEVV
jgi:hypothetical protein